MSWLLSGHHVINFSTRCGFQHLQDSSQDMAQNIISSPGEGTKDPWLCLLTKLLLFCPVAFVPLLSSLIQLILWLKTWFSSKESACQCRWCGFSPCIRKIPWRRKWQPTPVFLPGKFHGHRSLVGYSPQSPKELDTTERLHFHFSLLTPFSIISTSEFMQCSWEHQCNGIS